MILCTKNNKNKYGITTTNIVIKYSVNIHEQGVVYSFVKKKYLQQ